MNKKIELVSGATLEMTMLPFREGEALFSKVLKELLKVNIDIGTMQKDTAKVEKIEDLEIGSEVINTMKNVIFSLITSGELKSLITEGFKRCLYNNKKVDDALFEDVKNRADYYVVCWEVLWFNFSPFLPKNGLQLLSTMLEGINSQVPK